MCTSIQSICQVNVVVSNSVLMRLFGLAEIPVKHPALCNKLMWKFIVVLFNTGCDEIAQPTPTIIFTNLLSLRLVTSFEITSNINYN